MIIHLRKLTIQDLEEYAYWQLPDHVYHKYNGPYFHKQSKEEIEKRKSELLRDFENGNNDPLPSKRIILNSENEILGEVSWYWKSKETLWMEIGIVIYSEQNWGKSIGKRALELWINELFETSKDIHRLGLTTWSGNDGMIKLASKLNMKEEARYRKARIVDGVFYDSVSYGILREEWEAISYPK